MCDSVVIERLYANVLHEDRVRLKLSNDAIREAISNMKEVYKPDPNSLSSSTLDIANYNDASHRCAYLHKYAPLHTALVVKMLDQVVVHNVKCFKDLLNKNGSLNICSLGGGPGCDIIAALAVLHEAFGFFKVNATIVDIMIDWRHTFHSIIQELKYGEYGLLGDHVSEQYLNWSYEEANLIGKMTNGVNKAIASAHLITMVKFVSASSCKETSSMIGKIFRTMKQGALVLYIDNAGGGFHQMVRKEAQACNLITVFGPLKHELYENKVFDVKRFGYTPCLETKVTVHVWRKPLQGGNTNRNDNWSQQEHVDPGHTNYAYRNNIVPQPVILPATTNWGSGYRESGDPFVPNRVSNSRPPQRSRPRSRSRSKKRRPVQYQPRAESGVYSDDSNEDDNENNDCSCCVIS